MNPAGVVHLSMASALGNFFARLVIEYRDRNAQSDFLFCIGQRVRISRRTGARSQPDIREAEAIHSLHQPKN